MQRGQGAGSRMHGAGIWDLLQGSRAHPGPSTPPQTPTDLPGSCARPPAGSFAWGTLASEQQHRQPPWDPLGKSGPHQSLLHSSVLGSGCCPQTLMGGPTERGPVAHGPFPEGCPQQAATWAPSSAKLLEMQPSPLRGTRPHLPSAEQSGLTHTVERRHLCTSGQGPALQRNVSQPGLPGFHHQYKRNIVCQIPGCG